MDGAATRAAWLPVRNDAGQCSIWPAHRPTPPGWQEIGPAGDRASTLERVVLGWTDPIPAAPVPQGPLDADVSTVDNLVAAAALRYPDRIAVRDPAGDVSYRDLVARSARVRVGLRRLGVRRGSTVAVCLDRGADMLAILMGVLSAGAAYLPLDGHYPPARLAFMVRDAAAVCVVRAEHYSSALAGLELPVVDPAELLAVGSGAPGPPESDSQPDDIAYVIYTSGSTGRPKGVDVTHRNVVLFLDAMVQLLPAMAPDRVLFSTRLSFDIAGLEIFLPLTRGGTCVVAPQQWLERPRELASLVNDEEPTLIQATPVGWQLLLDGGVRTGSGQTLLCGGDVLPAPLAARLAERGATVFNMYGPTEATVWATAWRVGTDRVAIGQPLAHARAYVLDDGWQPVPPGDYGELYLAGAAVAEGYRGARRLTAERFVPDPWSTRPGARMYATGDIVRLVNGQLEFAHRRDTQVKLNGHRVELGEVESVALGVAQVRAAVAVVVDSTFGPALRLYVESAADADLVGHAVRVRMNELLPPPMVAQQVVVLASLPVTENGKVDRRALEQSDGQPADRAR